MSLLTSLLTRHRTTALATSVTAGILALILAARAFGLLVPLELMAYDFAVRLRAGNAVDPRIVMIYRTEEDLQKLGFPTTDETLAELLEKLESMKPAAIGVDIYRDFPVAPGSERLDQILGKQKNLVWITKFSDRQGHSVPPPKALRGKEAQVGFNDLLDDPGGVIRRGLLVLDNGKTSAYSFALQLALMYLKPEGLRLSPDPVNPEVIRVGQASPNTRTSNERSSARILSCSIPAKRASRPSIARPGSRATQLSSRACR